MLHWHLQYNRPNVNNKPFIINTKSYFGRDYKATWRLSIPCAMHQLSTLGKIMKPVSSSFRHTCSYSGGETRFWRQINWSQNGSPVAESFGEI